MCLFSHIYIPKVTHDLSKTYICDLGVAKIKRQATMTTKPHTMARNFQSPPRNNSIPKVTQSM